MASSFSDGTSVVRPFLVQPGEFSRAAQHAVNQVVGGGVDVMLRPAAPRSGTLSAVFFALADALALETMLAATKTVTFTDSDVPAFGMTFVAQDGIQVAQGEAPVTLSDGSQAVVWLVSFGFQQVS